MNSTDFENGIVYINGKEKYDISNIPWAPHPKFPGVFMKNLFSGKDSDNNLSAMLVKIEPLHEIGGHIHEGKAELHEVLSGNGTAMAGGNLINYMPGVISFIPGDIRHSIKADKEGIILLAKFTPPLS